MDGGLHHFRPNYGWMREFKVTFAQHESHETCRSITFYFVKQLIFRYQQ